MQVYDEQHEVLPRSLGFSTCSAQETTCAPFKVAVTRASCSTSLWCSCGSHSHKTGPREIKKIYSSGSRILSPAFMPSIHLYNQISLQRRSR